MWRDRNYLEEVKANYISLCASSFATREAGWLLHRAQLRHHRVRWLSHTLGDGYRIMASKVGGMLRFTSRARPAPPGRRVAVIPMTACRYGTLWLLSFALLAFGQSSTSSSIQSTESLLRAHHTARALQLLDGALRSSPNNPNLWTLKGIALSMQGNNADASTAFEHALHLAPNNLVALRGEVQILDQKHDKLAVPLLHRILAQAPHDFTAHEMLALYEQRDNHCKAAIADFRQSGPAMDHHPESLAAYGVCLNATGKTQEATSVFQKLSSHFPQLVFPKYDLALMMYHAKHYHKAIDILEPIIKSGKANPDVLTLASSAYEAVGDTPQAVVTLRKAIVQDPRNVNLYNTFALLCLDHKSYKVGIDMINAGIHYNPHASSLYLSRGLLYAKLSQFGKARSDFATADRLDSRQSVGSYAIDVAELEKFYFDNKHSDAIVQDLRHQLKTYPHSYFLHFLLAKLLSMQSSSHESSHLEHARLEAQAAVRIKPDFVPARDLLARIDINSHNFSDAARESRAALRYDPDDRSAVYHLILALRNSKQPQARSELKIMLKRLAKMESASTQNARHKKQFRLVEAAKPPQAQ